jgi:hypothetical protein
MEKDYKILDVREESTLTITFSRGRALRRNPQRSATDLE